MRVHDGAACATLPVAVRLTPRLAILLTLPPLFWAGNAVIGRAIAGGAHAGEPGAALVPPLTLNFLRWVLAALFLLPLGWRALVPWRQVLARWRYLLPVGVLGVGCYNSLQYLALRTSSPLNVTLVAASLPVWMLAVGALRYREAPGRPELWGAALGLVGVVLVVARGSLQTLLHVHFVPGDLYMVAAIVGWAFYSWLLARPPDSMRGNERPRWDWAGTLLVQILFGLVAAGPACAVEQALGAAPIAWGPAVGGTLLYVSLLASIVSYRAWGLGVAEGGPALAAFFNNLTPLFAALLSTLLLGEAPQVYHLVAFALIVAGIAISTASRR